MFYCIFMNTNFKKIGFDDNKSSVYMAVLSLGIAAVSDIAKKAGLVRTTVYKILFELVAEGLVEEIPGKVKRFSALHPSKLIEMMNEKKRVAENILPALLGMFAGSNFKPQMKFYEGETGKKKVFEDILNLRNDVVYTFSPVDKIIDLFGNTYVRHYMEKRVERNIWRWDLRASATRKFNKENDWEFYGVDENLMRKVRFLPKEIGCDVLIQIYANKVSVMAIKEDYAFIIESKELAGFLKQIFMWIWIGSK